MKESRIKNFYLLGSLGIFYLITPTPTLAQIIPDTTLPVNSIVAPSGNTSTITGGTAAGGNLFHSFREFSVLTGNTAYFNNVAEIQNIITRVTGSNISNIDGILQANGRANLFLINPNGIIFGPNASLNIGGSFLASSASSIKFADGSSFDASNPSAPPLLTVNVPIGLQFGPNPGRIVVQGTGHNLSVNRETFTTITDNRAVGLQVPDGQTLALVGGEVALEGGNVTAASGRIELGSVGAFSSISLNSPLGSGMGWSLGYSLVENFSDITLSNAASADASGSGGGNIQVRARNVSLADGSAILALTEGSKNGEKVEVNAAESVELIGTTPDGQYSSNIAIDVQPEATGNGGDLTIETGRLILRDGAQINSNTFSSGRGGSITVRATNLVEASSTSADGQNGSRLFANALDGTGDAGNLTIETARLIVRDGAQISSSTFSSGRGGTITIRASDSVEASGTTADGLYTSGLFADALDGTGDAGDLTIETARLIVRDGGQISSGTLSSGRGGTITVRASDSVEAIGTTADGLYNSGLFVSARAGTGDGGNLTIETARLIVRDGAKINSDTYSAGKGGTITVRATDSVEALGVSADGQYASALSGNVFDTGDGGDLTIETRRLILRDGGQISSSTTSAGKGGSLTVRASDSVEAIGESADGEFGSGLLAITGSDSTRDGGNLTIETRRLIVRGGASINSSTFGAGSGGTLTVRAKDSVELSGTSADGIFPSRLVASARAESTGEAGNIIVETGQLIIQNGAEINVRSQGTKAAGNMLVNAGTLRLERGSLTAATGAGGGNITVNSGDIQLRNNSTITTNATGTSAGGNITLNTDTLAALENSDITANSEESFGGRVIINARGIFGTEFRSNTSDLTSDITASSAKGAEFSGTVEINTPDVAPTAGLLTLPSSLVDVSRLIASECEALAKGSTFTLTGKGGLPPNPHEPLVGSATVIDWATLEGRGQETQGSRVESSLSNPQSQIVEATGWAKNDFGQVVLIANAPKPTFAAPWYASPSCQGMP